MARYTVDLSNPPRPLPPLLVEFGAWLAKQKHGSVGWFDRLHADPIDPGLFTRHDRGFAFLQLPDGSELALVDTLAPPAAVVLLGSDGEIKLVARSFEAFLVALAKGKTGVNDLDDEDCDGRPALGDWLGTKKVKAPRAPKLDLDTWLAEGTAQAIPPPPAPPKHTLQGIPPELVRLVSFLGRRADDPELVAFVRDLGQESPVCVSRDGGASVDVEERGLSLTFAAEVRHEDCPRAPLNARQAVPYLTLLQLDERHAGPLPFGVIWGLDAAGLEARLGPPSFRRPTKTGGEQLAWRKTVDEAWGLELDLATRKGVSKDLAISVRQGLELLHEFVPKPVVGLIVAWAATRGFLDERRFARHAGLVADVKARRRRGSELPLERGLWDVHFVDRLRWPVHAWCTKPDDEAYYKKDLGGVFGLRKDEHGHDEIVLDDDSWEAVDRAAAILDRRFA